MSVPLPPALECAVFVPGGSAATSSTGATKTELARAILPDAVTRPDVVFNLSRVALLVAAMSSGDLSTLKIATEDALHQVWRRARDVLCSRSTSVCDVRSALCDVCCVCIYVC